MSADKMGADKMGADQIDKQELIDRYVYDVTRRLPEKMRQDIGKELRTLIEDMAEDKDIEGVLEELGNPAILARKYRGDSGSLISGTYYDTYWFILKIALSCTAVGLLISGVFSGFVQVVSNMDILGEDSAQFFGEVFQVPSTGIGIRDLVGSGWAAGLDLFSSTVGILLNLFAIITIIFMILEKYQVGLREFTTGTFSANAEEWDISRLPQIPVKEAVIQKGSMISEIVFSMITALILIAVPHWLGVWIAGSEDDKAFSVIPVFNMEAWGLVLPLLITATFFGMMKSIVKLVQGCYNIPVMIVTAVLNFISIAIYSVVFLRYPIWNPDFRATLERVFEREFNAAGDIMNYWDTPFLSNLIFAIFVIVLVIETITVAYRVLKNQQAHY